MSDTYFIPPGELEHERLQILHQAFLKPTAELLLSCGLSTSHHHLQKIFDVGCATGLMSQWMADQTSSQVIGLDLDPIQIDAASQFAQKRHQTNLSFELYDLGGPSPFSSQADLTYCRFVLHHLKDPKQGIRNLIDMTKPNANIIFIEPIMDGRWAYPETTAVNELYDLLLDMNQDHHWDPDYGKKLLSDLSSFSELHIEQVENYRPILMSREQKAHDYLAIRIFKEQLLKEKVTDEKTLMRLEDKLKEITNEQQFSVSLFSGIFIKAKKIN